jgi:hypothetical protein
MVYWLYPYDITNPDFKFILTWTTEDDNDDIIENIINTLTKSSNINEIIKDIRLNYMFINEFLLEYTYNIFNITDMNKKYNFKIKSNSHIQSLINYVETERKDLNKFEIVKKIFNLYVRLIEYLYHSYFTTFIKLDEYSYITDELVLYRGFNYNKYTKLLLDKTKFLNINDEFNTSYFMSTSIYETTAYRFIRNNNIIWKINIPKSKFNKFYYSYLSSKKHYFNNSLAKNQQETEFLLNMNAKLKLINKYQKNNKLYYEWEFLEYELLSDDYFTNLNKYKNQILDFIKLYNNNI